ncbi:unnamed protein product [Brassicogethes aeneus]|uniref:Uncharacterized protein n=1 Tax=Brassicogethes aeneus TaxID=1431903 RepID=A0A9P0B0A6_BRAAE|nr:unnamed protein product [Brassicogethes aeneus]
MKFFLALAFVAVASAASLGSEKDAQIISQESDISPDGSFKTSFQTDNGIAAQEQGVLKNAQTPEGAILEVQGSAQWTSPEGTPVAFQYIANENGYQPQSDLLPVGPTPPPIPAAIQRSLDWIAAHPQKEEQIQIVQRRF